MSEVDPLDVLREASGLLALKCMLSENHAGPHRAWHRGRFYENDGAGWIEVERPPLALVSRFGDDVLLPTTDLEIRALRELWRRQVEQAGLERSDIPVALCSEPGCRRAVQARGLCSAHYAAWWRAHRGQIASEKSMARIAKRRRCRPAAREGAAGPGHHEKRPGAWMPQAHNLLALPEVYDQLSPDEPWMLADEDLLPWERGTRSAGELLEVEVRHRELELADLDEGTRKHVSFAARRRERKTRRRATTGTAWAESCQVDGCDEPVRYRSGVGVGCCSGHGRERYAAHFAKVRERGREENHAA